MPKLSLVIFSMLAFCLLGACERIEDVHYKNGYSQGYADGKQAGYKEGYQTVHVGTDHRYSPAVATTHRVFAFFGGLKIIVGLVIFSVLLFERSKSNEEIAAKILFGVIGSAAAFFTMPLLRIQDGLSALLVSPSFADSFFLWCLILAVALVTFIFASIIEKLFAYIHGIWIEVWGLFAAAALVTVLLHALFNMFWYSPDINEYLGSDILVGVFVGGLMYIAVKLVHEAIKKRAAVNG